MATIELTNELRQHLCDIAKRRGEAPSELAQRVLDDFVQRSSTTVPKNEADLIREINEGLDEETWHRYRELVSARRDETLTPHEHEELKRLTDEVEVAHARRLEKLVQLAAIRNVSVDDLISEFGLRSEPCTNE